MAKQHGIPVIIMRGGTSKGPYFRTDDLPADTAARDRVEALAREQARREARAQALDDTVTRLDADAAEAQAALDAAQTTDAPSETIAGLRDELTAARATAANPVTLELPECEFRIFARTQTEECAKALGFLTKRGIAYERQTAESVTLVVGDTRVEGFNEDALAAAQAATSGSP